MLKKQGIINKYIMDNRGRIFVLLFLLVIGCIIGICVANCLQSDIKTELLEFIEENNKLVMEKNYTVSNYEIVKSVFLDVLTYIGIIVILGCSIIFSPFIHLVILHKGFSIGFCLSLLIMLLGNVKGSIYALISMLLPNLVMIIGIIYISILWIEFGKKILKNRQLYGIKSEIYSRLVLSGAVLVSLLVLLSPIELFTNGMLNSYIKII